MHQIVLQGKSCCQQFELRYLVLFFSVWSSGAIMQLLTLVGEKIKNIPHSYLTQQVNGNQRLVGKRPHGAANKKEQITEGLKRRASTQHAIVMAFAYFLTSVARGLVPFEAFVIVGWLEGNWSVQRGG